MSLLKELLKKKKIFELEQDIEKFIEDNEIPVNSTVHKIIFTKKEFDMEQSNDFLEANFIDGYGTLSEEEDRYESVLFDEIAFAQESFMDIELREGIIITIGVMRQMSSENPVLFSNKTPKTYKFTDDHPYIIEIAKVVKGFHMSYGEVEITQEDLISFKNNFDNNVVGVDISIDFDHETREAAGWLRHVFLNEDGTVLYGSIRWTPKGALALSNREFRYFSPEFNRNYIHPHTREEYGPTLTGGGLVNRPFLKMEAIVSLKNKNNGGPKVDTIKLSDHEAKVGKLEKEISDLKLSENVQKTKMAELTDKNTQLSDEIATLKANAEKAKKEAEHKQLFDEGKINKAQLTALNEGKTMVEVLALSEQLNTKAEGTGGEPTVDLSSLTEEELKFCEKYGHTPEEYIAANKGH